MPQIYANDIGDRLKTWTKHRQNTPNPPSNRRMDKPVFSFEHETNHPAPGLDIFATTPCYRASRPPPADESTLHFLQFGVLGDVDDATQHQQEDQQRFHEMQPVFKQKGSKSVNRETYTEFCGVYSPEKMPPVSHGREKDTQYSYSRCDSGSCYRKGVKRRFLGCIIMHGNLNVLV